MLQACLNGARTKSEHPLLPVSAGELAIAATQAIMAGADELHIHPRDAEGRESILPHDVASTLKAVRAAVPGVPIGISTGRWIPPLGEERFSVIERWTERPDYASVNFYEDECIRHIDALARNGVPIEAGLYSIEDAQLFVTSGCARFAVRAMIEMTSEDPDEALIEAADILDILEEAGIGCPVLLHGQEETTWEMVSEAASRGLSTRIGFEDSLYLPDGTMAADNAAMVSAAVGLLARA
ncbi:hypothetical protein E1162_11940 [Rhodobacteraceae bacterium RKSG542]|uniref:3-keto-5-aminohexanoate cleavage protein n=1 Tax=Pseudovibrio flavus TaxID=2529854 RepID=UPI0012BD6063|nr:3-keto-5-aminohexanoate cleavage protein [Pseudovibrio flavus]MTI17948.1 hypothetical protein [Pseudovibrio flavus]